MEENSDVVECTVQGTLGDQTRQIHNAVLSLINYVSLDTLNFLLYKLKIMEPLTLGGQQ